MTHQMTAAGLPLRMTGTLKLDLDPSLCDTRVDVLRRIRDELARDEWPTTPNPTDNDEAFSWMQPADTDPR
ncbi:hypothetical protein SAMN05421805_10626 [Saccharopolyspora antimicrobica]|uniref:Uncharacterized protein n=1 Tax=Saccharopolyspora antimicrobica TaxID=455193 RepID=A0A1I5AW23_9PSEU|nr:hypothetical protein [Saccharopolyspora antimicrobica]RKT86385.1 hypothetical protein ATL45_4751 [Saccharopolyspora antimicrobica]SFN66645.1 hypothetical protein SAMN05421805_10626 [Saccharopolyspora antimicrobica]